MGEWKKANLTNTGMTAYKPEGASVTLLMLYTVGFKTRSISKGKEGPFQ